MLTAGFFPTRKEAALCIFKGVRWRGCQSHSGRFGEEYLVPAGDCKTTFWSILCSRFRASLIYINNCPTRFNTKQSIYYPIILQVHSTCFGCQPHPSSGAHKTVTTASGTGQVATSEGGSCTNIWLFEHTFLSPRLTGAILGCFPTVNHPRAIARCWAAD